jgi:glycosyltransferase involved in cell wall biosynthesis
MHLLLEFVARLKDRLHILRVVIGLHQGGVQQGVLNLCSALDPREFRIIVVALENGGAVASEIERAGAAEVIVLGNQRKPWRTIPALVRLMRERQIDVVHASSYHPSLYARIAAIIAGVPVRMSYEHSVFENKRPFRILLNRLLEPFTHAFTAVGGAVAGQIRDWYGYQPDKVHVIHNGVDVEQFRPAVDRKSAKSAVCLDPERPVVGMVCRLDAKKGHCFFFEAVKELSQTHDVQWLVIGAGRGEALVKAQAKEMGVDGLVQFWGMRRDIPQILAALDVYVFPTLQEGFSNSLLEALSSGCAVVASDFPGNLEVVRHNQNGLVVPMSDSGAISAAVHALLDDPQLAQRLSVQARADIERNFSIAVYASKLSKLYKTLWQKRRNGISEESC